MNEGLFSKLLNLSRKGYLEQTFDKNPQESNMNLFKTSISTSDNEFNTMNITSTNPSNHQFSSSNLTNSNIKTKGKRIIDSPRNNKYAIYNTKVGLENLGNTCYFNTSLNCLIHSKRFITEFMKFFKIKTDTSTISCKLYKLLTEIVKLEYNDTYKPKELLTTFCQKHKKFKGYIQHDAQEFLRILLEDISNDLNKVKKVPDYKELKLKNKSKVQANIAFHDLFLEREDSIIIDLFYGQVCNIFACELCNHKTFSFEKIMDIPILLEEVKEYELMELLNFHFKDDVIQWDKKCESNTCDFRGNHIKSSRISILPKILIITVQRYNYRSKKKNPSKIIFNQTIDISKFVDSDCVNIQCSTKYNLYSVSNHVGGLDFGHYYAYCRIENNWYEFNDSYVTNIKEIQYESSTVYALFYELYEDY